MAASFAVHPFLIFFVFLFVTSIIASAATSRPPKHYGVHLIHRDSPQSPYHNSKSTVADRANWAIESSISRYDYLSMKQNPIAGYGTHTDALRTTVTADGFEYLIKLTIGTPPVPIYLVIDTADEFLWTQCEPCTPCFKQPIPTFDPRKSSTYSNVSCDSPFCKFILNKDCTPTCIYHYTNRDGSNSTGFVGNEVLIFTTIDGSTSTLPNVTFGCGFQNGKSLEQGDQTGVLGLAPVEISLVHHPSLKSPKFSYCVGNLSDQFAVGNFILGEEAYIAGATTPMIQKGIYYVKLLDISVAQQKLNIPPGTFDLKPSGVGGVTIDSGSKLTFLAPEGYRRLSVALSNMLERYFGAPTPDPQGGGKLCFVGSVSRDLENFPEVEFHFDGDADLVLGKWSVFLQVTEQTFCLAFLPGKPDDLTVIGNLAQQFYNFGFDLAKNVITFQSLDCTII